MLPIILLISAILFMFASVEYQAAPAGWYTIYINCNGGTFEEAPGVNLYDTEHVLEAGATHAVEFRAQWQGSTIKAITYAALYSVTGDVDYNVKITLVNNGVSYSGQGFVSIPESIYSTWTGSVECYWEFPGEYINANYQYIADYFDAGSMSVADFKREKNCWQMMFKYSGEPEVFPPQSVIDNFFTNHFSVYIIAEVEEVVEEENTSEGVVDLDIENTENTTDNNTKEPNNSMSWIWIVIGIVALIVVVIIVMIKKK